MALFSSNITVKFQSDVDVQNFLTTVEPGTGLNSLFRGELAILSNDEGISLYTLDGLGEVTLVRPSIDELPDIDVYNPQAGDVFIYNKDEGGDGPPAYPGRPYGKWINVPAPRPDLSGNRIFELKDVIYSSEYQAQDGSTLVWEPVDPDDIEPGQPVGYWKFGRGVTNSILNDFGDVLIDSSPLDGQTLVYDAPNSTWRNGFYPEGLGDLIDVDLDTIEPLDGDVLLYDGLSSKWVPGVVSGGNVNVEILTDTNNLPVASLGTLGVTEEDANGDGGDFYWIQKDNTNDWGRAAKAGEVSVGDFKDIDLTGLKEGQGLRWTYTENGFKFLPTDLAPLPFQQVWEIRVSDTAQPDYGWETRGRGFALSTFGQDKARGYINHNLIPDLAEDVPMLLGMYGDSATQRGIHVDCSEINKDWEYISFGGSGYFQLNDDFNYGFLRFPDDLTADENGLLGIRPISAEGSVPWGSYMDGKTDARWTMRMWVRPTSFQCILFDYGTFKLELLDQQRARTVWTIGGIENTAEWILAEPLESDEWTEISWGSTAGDFGPDPDVPGANYIREVEFRVNGARCLTTDARLTIKYDGELALTAPDVTQRPLPIIGEGFTGSMAAVQFLVDPERALYDQHGKGAYVRGLLPTTTLTAGQIVGIRRPDYPEGTYTRLATVTFDEETFGKVEPGMGFSTFGSRTQFQDLADFDKQSLVDQGEGWVYWDAEQGKFLVTNDAPEWTVEYELQRAQDVRARRPNGERMQEGDALFWNDTLDRFEAGPTSSSFRINDAEDVDTAGGIENGETLVWSDADQAWKPGYPANVAPPALDDLTDVQAGPDTVADNYTLLYSEAFQQWYAAPAPNAGVDKLSDMRDVDDTGIKDGEVLAWDVIEQKYKPAGTLQPTVLNDLGDVNTEDRPPQKGQGLQWNGSLWAPGSFLKGGASAIAEMYDVNVEKAPLREGQALVWGGTYWENREVSAGQGDGGDWETGLVRVSFTPGIWGGGDFDATSGDKPIEQLGSELFRGGGDFF